ncbi:mucin-2 [Drosophila kikkawai]|uniref:Mucin-2 n=1 Tax=Drosophila kikkawai TaxID=30033 RepID=A0A6P4II03_DROKI|nr:mucin-5AC [Drosophila kikkawai]
MTLRLVSIFAAALFLLFWPAQLDAFITSNTGCHHNGTWFADKSVVPSMEKCLNCQCNRKTLVCRLKVCPEMPMPPPRGCVVVQKKSTCCPYLSCARLDAFYKIPTKRRIIAYLDHYERESIDRVVNDNMLQRRSDDSDTDLFVCVKNGTVYKSGSAMSSSNLCSYCYCIGGTEKCVKPKCMLPVEGCKPIFVDSTCCPVRYDCSSKTSGKSSQEVRYRKTSNKHFQRMSQRLQRNRGCTVGTQFYAEGQKMRSDVDRPCDICFCIRGTRRCAPKKCSPALKNCIPVVPKGQCCPSSYDCGSQRDYRRSHNSRQFNLYNMLFGKDEPEVQETGIIPQNSMAERYPHDRHPTRAPQGNPLEASSEKSILDTLREGLEFIDGNNNKMLANNLDLVGIRTTQAPPLMRTEPNEEGTSSTTALSFLDLLLGPSTENVVLPEEVRQPESTTVKNTLSWMDILLGPDDEEMNPATEAYTEPSSTHNQSEEVKTSTNSIKRIAEDFEEQFDNGEMAAGELPAEAQQISMANSGIWPKPVTEAVLPPAKEEPSLFNALIDGLSGILKEPLNQTSTSTTSTTTSTEKPLKTNVFAPPMFRPLPSGKPTHTRINSKLANLTVTPPMLVVTSKYGQHQPVTHRTAENRVNLTTTTEKPTSTTQRISMETTTMKTTPKPSSTAKPKLKTTRKTITTPKPTTSQPTTQKPTTLRPTTKKPVTTKPTTQKPKTPRPLTTTTPPKTTSPTLSTTPSPTSSTTPSTPSSTTHSTTSSTISTTPKPISTPQPTIRTTGKPKFKPKIKPYTTSTPKPLVIKTNPSILEAEPLEDSSGGEPTLPPSLPNLKIIPFLPTDAVETVPKDSYPSNFYQQKVASDKMDVVGYDTMDDSVALYTQSQPDQAAYKYKFNVEVPAVQPAPEPVVHLGGKYEGSAAYVKFDFERPVVPPQHNGFSPPTETEGGFMPKEPLVIDGEVLQEHVTSSGINGPLDSFHVTQHIIDITTSGTQDNDTASIEITTPDPFKDVIHTEPSPNLDELIVDKANKQPAIEEHIETVTFSVSNSTSTSSSSTSFSSPTSISTAATTTTSTEKETPLIDKYEINKLDKLLDELLGLKLPQGDVVSSTVPPFKQMPKATAATATAATPTSTTSVTGTPATAIAGAATATAGRPTGTTRAPGLKKGGNKTKNKQTAGNRRKVQSATRRQSTPAPTRAPPATARTPSTPPPLPTAPAPATSTTTATRSTTLHPFLNSPFDKLPFMDASYEVRPHRLPPMGQEQQLQSHEQPTQQFHHYQHATRPPTTAAPPAKSAEEEAPLSERMGAPGFPAMDGGDPLGQLKLAGCNIYGRMYRVGRIIVELSSQCLECKCTEVGVKCGPLDC